MFPILEVTSERSETTVVDRDYIENEVSQFCDLCHHQSFTSTVLCRKKRVTAAAGAVATSHMVFLLNSVHIFFYSLHKYRVRHLP